MRADVASLLQIGSFFWLSYPGITGQLLLTIWSSSAPSQFEIEISNGVIHYQGPASVNGTIGLAQ